MKGIVLLHIQIMRVFKIIISMILYNLNDIKFAVISTLKVSLQ